MPVLKRKPPPAHRPMFAKKPRTGKDGTSLRARQRANLAAMRARVQVILARTAAGRAYFDAIIAGRAAVKPTMTVPRPGSARAVAPVTPIPYGADMSLPSIRPNLVGPPPHPQTSSTPPDLVDVPIDAEVYANLEIFAKLVGRPVNDVAEYILTAALPKTGS